MRLNGIVLKKRLWLGQLLRIGAALPILAACSPVGFSSTPDPAAEMAALCGTDGTASLTGPKITSPTSSQLVNSNITLVGTCVGSADVTITGGGLAASVTTPCTNGQFQQAIQLQSGDGTKNLAVSQTGVDGQGKVCVVLDTTPPKVAITAPPAGYVARNGVLLVGTCTGSFPVNISGTGVDQPSTTNCNNGQFSTAVNFSAGEGTKPVTASQTDTVGNTGSDSRTFVRDLTPPQIMITSPDAGTLTFSTIALTGTCESFLDGPIDRRYYEHASSLYGRSVLGHCCAQFSEWSQEYRRHANGCGWQRRIRQ